MKKFLYFYLIAILMMANDALFNWLGAKVGVPFWRQLIWVIGLVILIKIAKDRKYKIPYIRKTYRQYSVMFGIVVVLAILTLLLEGFNIVRILMSFFEYFFGIVFLVFPLVCAQSGWSRSKINKFFIIMGCFTSTGLLLDFSTGGAITSFFKIVTMQSVDEYQFDYYGRFSFMSTTDSIFTLILCLSTICCFHEYTEKKNALSKLVLLLLSAFIMFGSIFTGARQTLAALLIVEVFGLFYVLRGNKKGILLLGSMVVVLLLAMPSAQRILSKNEGFENRFNKTALQEDERSAVWQEGYRYCFVNTNLQRIIIGDGVGYTLGTYAASNEAKMRLFESSFIARIIDVGVPMALALLLMPVLYVTKYHRIRKVNTLYFSFLFAYIFISLISPNGLTNQSQMTLFIMLGLFYRDNDLELYDSKRSIVNKLENK